MENTNSFWERATESSKRIVASGEGVDLLTSGRSNTRTMVGVVLGSQFYPGDRVLQACGGDQDVPLAFAKCPYLF